MINIFQPVGSSPTTTEGDLIVRGASSDGRLAIGANATVLTSNGTTATWAAAAGGGLTIGTTTITSGTSTRLLFDASGVVSETDGATWDATNKALTVGGATVTTSNPVLNLSQTWNAGAVTFTGIKLNVTNTTSAADSLLMDLQVGGASFFKVLKSGAITLGSSPSSTIVTGTYNSEIAFFPATGSTIQAPFYVNGNSIACQIRNDGYYGFSNDITNDGSSTPDVRLYRAASGILGVRAGSSTAGAAISMVEQTAPSAPSANGVYIYAEDNGSGKTRLMALFNSGAAQQVAIEP